MNTSERRFAVSDKRAPAFMAWVIASVFYGYVLILRVMPNIMMNDILQQFNIDTTTFGQFSGFYYVGYVLMHLPIGLALDRYGPKKIMPICILVTTIGMLPILFSEYWVFAILGRTLIGIGSSAAILGIFKIIRFAFSEKKFARMLSFSVTIGMIGAIFGGEPINYMCDTLGYKAVTSIFAGIGVGLSLIMYLMVPNSQPQRSTAIRAQIKKVFLSPKVILVCIFAGLMVGPMEGFADVWGTEFLKKVYGFDGTLAASLPSAIFMGMCFGGPVLSFIAEKSGRYLGTIIGAGIVMALSFFALLSAQIPASVMSIMFFTIGICCAYQIIAIYKASTYVNENVAGLTTALANMIIMSFGYVFHTIIGWVINRMGDTMDSEAFTYGMMVIPIFLCIGVIGLISISLHDRIKTIRGFSTVVCKDA